MHILYALGMNSAIEPALPEPSLTGSACVMGMRWRRIVHALACNVWRDSIMG